MLSRDHPEERMVLLRQYCVTRTVEKVLKKRCEMDAFSPLLLLLLLEDLNRWTPHAATANSGIDSPVSNESFVTCFRRNLARKARKISFRRKSRTSSRDGSLAPVVAPVVTWSERPDAIERQVENNKKEQILAH